MKYFFNNHIHNQDLYLYSGGFDPTKPGHTYGPTTRSGFMLHYIYKGKGTFICQEKQYELEEGQFFFIEPNTTITYVADDTDPWQFYWIGFRGTLAEAYLKRTSISKDNPVFSDFKTLHIKDLLSDIIELSLLQEDNDILLNSKLLAILHELTCHFPSEKNHSHMDAQKNPIFIEALQFIRNNYEYGIKIEDVARSLNIDRTYLHRLFKKELQISPKEHLIQLRLKKAKELLRHSNLPINVIAYSVGMESPQNFSKLFKLQTGHSPLNYRSLNTNKET